MYTFTPYDVLQINRDGRWLDFTTLRTPAEGKQAEAMVASGRWDGTVGNEFRIVRRDEVVLSRSMAVR